MESSVGSVAKPEKTYLTEMVINVGNRDRMMNEKLYKGLPKAKRKTKNCLILYTLPGGIDFQISVVAINSEESGV